MIARAIVLVIVLAMHAHAQTFGDSARRLYNPRLPAERRLIALGGLHFGAPALASLAVGPAYLVGGGRDAPAYVAVLAEPGMHAGRLSLAYLKLTGNLGTGWSARATFLQEWRPFDDAGTRIRGRRAGVEFHMMLLFLVGGRVGVFQSVGPNATSGKAVFGDLSIGL